MWLRKFFRLGLGAKAAPGVKRVAPTDPVERRLLRKVNAQKRRALEDENSTAKEANEASDDDEPESRTSAFSKKRPLPSVTSTPLGKKAKWQSVCIDYLSDQLVLVAFLTNSQTDAIFMGIVCLLIVQCVIPECKGIAVLDIVNAHCQFRNSLTLCSKINPLWYSFDYFYFEMPCLLKAFSVSSTMLVHMLHCSLIKFRVIVSQEWQFKGAEVQCN